MNPVQLKYARDRARSIKWALERRLREKFTVTKTVSRVEKVLDEKAHAKAHSRMEEAYDRLLDELVLGDEAKAMKLLQDFAKQV